MSTNISLPGLQQDRQAQNYCFIGHSHDAEWKPVLTAALQDVLPNFGLTPWYADDYFDATAPLREKVVSMIANTRYGIYDLSYWQDTQQQWIMPRNVLIELGMAIALNRPMLLLRHANNRNIALPECLQGISGQIHEFTGGTKSLKQALETHLPDLIQQPPERDWLNRYCTFGNRICPYRTDHPQSKQWFQTALPCHISDGSDCDRADFRDTVETVLGYFSDVRFHYLDSYQLPQGYSDRLCSHCQAVRSSPFALYRITPDTSPDTYIAIGISIALERQFDYKIPKILLTSNEQHVPSLLKGYEVIIVKNDLEIKKRLKKFLPQVIQQSRQTTWKPRPLPFEVFIPAVETPIPVPKEVQIAELPLKAASLKGEGDQTIEGKGLLAEGPVRGEGLPSPGPVRGESLPPSGPVRGESLPPSGPVRGERPEKPEATPVRIGNPENPDTIRVGNGTELGPLRVGNGPEATRPIERQRDGKINVFISYAHKDEDHLTKLKRHLISIRRSLPINIWDNSMIIPGEVRGRKARERLSKADIILLLISADYLDSDRTYMELQQAVEQYKQGLAHVIPIILHPCLWQDTPIGTLKVLPNNKIPISEWSDKDGAYDRIARSLREIIADFDDDTGIMEMYSPIAP